MVYQSIIIGLMVVCIIAIWFMLQWFCCACDNAVSESFTYSNLNFWRKLYLSLTWTGAFLVSFSLIWFCLAAKNDFMLIYLPLPIVTVLFSSWIHYAVVNRKLKQLYWIAFLSFIPLMNIIGALIMLSIARVTKLELSQLQNDN